MLDVILVVNYGPKKGSLLLSLTCIVTIVLFPAVRQRPVLYTSVLTFMPEKLLSTSQGRVIRSWIHLINLLKWHLPWEIPLVSVQVTTRLDELEANSNSKKIDSLLHH